MEASGLQPSPHEGSLLHGYYFHTLIGNDVYASFAMLAIVF